MAHNVHISLDPKLEQRARKQAEALGISLSAYVRRLLTRDLEQSNAESAGADSIVDLGDSGGSDVARRENEMLGEAIAARRV